MGDKRRKTRERYENRQRLRFFHVLPIFLQFSGHLRVPQKVVGRRSSICDPSIPPEEFLGPSGPKLETELKMSSRGLPAPGFKKLKTESKKSRKMEISTIFQLYRLFFDSVFNFLDPGAGRPRELIFSSISNFGPEGPKNSSGGIEGSQSSITFHLGSLF